MFYLSFVNAEGKVEKVEVRAFSIYREGCGFGGCDWTPEKEGDELRDIDVGDGYLLHDSIGLVFLNVNNG